MKFLPNSDIENVAIDFLKAHHPRFLLPVPIEEIAAFKMGLKIIPVGGMKNGTGVDGCLSADLKNIYIDQDQYLNQEFRSRFTIAHELGHYVMHSQDIRSLKIKSDRSWKQLVLSSKKSWGSMEYQAYMFAGYVLIPTPSLEMVLKNIEPAEDEYDVFSTVRKVAKIFHVSDACAEKRLFNHQLLSSKSAKRAHLKSAGKQQLWQKHVERPQMFLGG